MNINQLQETVNDNQSNDNKNTPQEEIRGNIKFLEYIN